jgi:uncharacterized protein YbcI
MPSTAPALTGERLSELSNAVVKIHFHFHGRGPTSARSIAGGECVATVLEDVLTSSERMLMASGQEKLVQRVRDASQAALAEELTRVVERVTGREVVAYAGAVDLPAGVATETFLLAPSENDAVATNGDAVDGPLLAEVSTALVQLHRRSYGRGPTRAKSIVSGDVLTTVLRDIYTTVEKTLVEHRKGELVRRVRSTFQQAMRDEFVDTVERVVGRKVISVANGVDVRRAIAFETFVFEPSTDRDAIREAPAVAANPRAS